MTALDDLINTHYHGDAVQAMMDICRKYGIAVAYLNRECFEAHVAKHRGDDRPLTDAEWAVLARDIHGEPTDYDNWVDNTRGPTEKLVPDEFMNHMLEINHIEPPDTDVPWESEADKEPGYRNGW